MGKYEISGIDLQTVIFPCRTSAERSIETERRALHEEIEVKCFYEGESTLLIGEEKVLVRAGDVVVINPYEFHATIDCGRAGGIGKYHSFMFPLDLFSGGAEVFDLRSLLLENSMTFKTLFCDNKRMVKILCRIVREYEEKNTAYQVAVMGLIMEFFAILIRRGLSGEAESGKKNLRSYRLVEPAIRHIRDRFREEVTVEQLAEACHVSKHYFCRAFRSVTGKTAMEYLREYRLRVADILLGNSDRAIAAIAEECGFESFSYFCRSYKKYYGSTPSDRRRESSAS